MVPNLHPGNEYMFEITTEAHGRKSKTTSRKIRTMPLIKSEITVINQQEVTTALTLRYTPTPFPSSYFDTYRFMLSESKIEEKAATSVSFWKHYIESKLKVPFWMTRTKGSALRHMIRAIKEKRVKSWQAGV